MNRNLILNRMLHSYFFMTGIICLVLVLLVIHVMPIFIEWDPISTSLTERFVAPEYFANGLKGHILGTDQLGRDILIRLLVGGQYSFRLAFICVPIITFIGCVLGIVAGYFGGWIDVVIMRLCETMMAIPSLIMAIAIIAILGQSFTILVLVLCIGGWVQLTKLVRNNVRIVKDREFVLASKALGAKGSHIMFKQIFPNITTQIIVLTSQRVGGIILMESSLSYLNLGIAMPAPSWGNMMSQGRQYLTTQPWMIVVPGIALMISVLACNFTGDGIRDVLDTKRKV